MLRSQLAVSVKRVLEPFLAIAKEGVLAKEIYPSLFLAGGAITSTIAGEQPSDYDFFSETPAAALTLFQQIKSTCGYLKSLELEFKEDFAVPGLFLGCLTTTDCTKSLATQLDFINSNLKRSKTQEIVAYVSNNAITLKNGFQLTFRFVGQPEVVFNTFDYEHCKVYFKLSPLGTAEPVFLGDSMRAIATRELLYTGNSRFVLSAFSRFNKFVGRGWKAHNSVLLKLMLAMDTIDWSSLKAVESELHGFYGITPLQVEEVLTELKKREKFSLKEITELVEGL